MAGNFLSIYWDSSSSKSFSFSIFSVSTPKSVYSLSLWILQKVQRMFYDILHEMQLIIDIFCPFWKNILKVSYDKSLGCYTKLKLCFSSVAACAYFSRVSINDFFIMLSPMLNSWDDGQSLSQILKWTVICKYCLIKSEKWKTSN